MDDQGYTGSVITHKNWHEYGMSIAVGSEGADASKRRERTALLRLIDEALPVSHGSIDHIGQRQRGPHGEWEDSDVAVAGEGEAPDHHTELR
jgi:hypothetical protein